jgi:hypothetical protein
LSSLGEKDVKIIDIDMAYGISSVSVELFHKSMVETLKKIDGTSCLGEILKVRRINDESAQTNALASAIALNALRSLVGDHTCEGNADIIGTLKAVNASSVIKVSNVFDRDSELTPELYEDLLEDMED